MILEILGGGIGVALIALGFLKSKHIPRYRIVDASTDQRIWKYFYRVEKKGLFGGWETIHRKFTDHYPETVLRECKDYIALQLGGKVLYDTEKDGFPEITS